MAENRGVADGRPFGDVMIDIVPVEGKLQLLRAIEFVHDRSLDAGFCPRCEGKQPSHDGRCELAALISRTELLIGEQIAVSKALTDLAREDEPLDLLGAVLKLQERVTRLETPAIVVEGCSDRGLLIKALRAGDVHFVRTS
jgi:hypothetical protein